MIDSITIKCKSNNKKRDIKAPYRYKYRPLQTLMSIHNSLYTSNLCPFFIPKKHFGTKDYLLFTIFKKYSCTRMSSSNSG